MSSADLVRAVSPELHAVDVVTVAQALWFDLPAFYAQVNPVVRRPNDVFTAWCYTLPLVDPRMDSAFNWYYMTLGPYYDAERRLMEEEYRSIAFPFGPLRERTTQGRSSSCQRWTWGWMGTLANCIRLGSAYQMAKDRGVKLLGEEVVIEKTN
ncbi:hypothetical protein QJS04_geneDACA024384 [Acorus gramineus]|uniref:Uncharacterized protein n=1 Tax=Acorus gramineus TaxID=55184 RepID=A0AAV8ZX66_ACOGR|nr:hypothetical protein QJS04_geneDACA024384 [Acorus gramineus]